MPLTQVSLTGFTGVHGVWHWLEKTTALLNRESPKSTAITQHGTIEEILKHLDASKYPVPDDWLEPVERAENRKQAKEKARERKEARATEEAKPRENSTKEETIDDTGSQNEHGGSDGDVTKETESSSTVAEKEKGVDDPKKGGKAKKEETDGVVGEGNDSSIKRQREPEKEEESEEEMDDTPPMYRLARGLFLKPEV